MAQDRETLAILGGTGPVGQGLAWRWARAGYEVIVGSRSHGRAVEKAAGIIRRVPGSRVRGLENLAAAEAGEIAVLTVPFESQRATLESVRPALCGKLLVDVTVPLRPPRVGTVQLPPEGSAALLAQETVGEEVRVVSAFQNIAADHLQADHDIDCDVLVCGNRVEDRDRVIALAEAAGMRAWDAGPLANAVAAEALTSVLIRINRRYKIGGAGLRITGSG